MTNDKFAAALVWIAREEGGLSDRSAAADPGGRTNIGITQATLDAYRRMRPSDGEMPRLVDGLTRELAGRVYRALFWDTCRCDELPAPVALAVFDSAVMSGPFDGKAGRVLDDAIEWLQSAVGVKVDGKIGANTIAAIESRNPLQVALSIITMRLIYQTRLPNFPQNPGWLGRSVRLAAAVTQISN